MEDDKLPAGVVLEMSEPLYSCLGCYFFGSKGKCPREPDNHNYNRLSCINGRNVIFKEIGVDNESK